MAAEERQDHDHLPGRGPRHQRRQLLHAGAAAGSKGYDKTYGKVKFYEGPLPSDFKTNNPATVAGILYSSTSAPWYWDGSGVSHDLVCTWDDTVSPSQSNITTKP